MMQVRVLQPVQEKNISAFTEKAAQVWRKK
jgi:hypothetical protein